MFGSLVLAAAVALVVVTPVSVSAQLAVLCPRATQTPVSALAAEFKRETGTDVKLTFGTAGGLRAKAAAGEPGDLIIGGASGIDQLARAGTVTQESRVELGTVMIGVAVRAGAVLPDVGTPASLRQAILAARSLGYADPARGGQGGTHFARVLEQLGLADTMKAKTTLFPEGLAALERVAAGEIELAVSPISEIVSVPGVALAGPLPDPLQARLTYSAAILTRAQSPEAAGAFLRLLTSPTGRARFRAAGFETPK
jgi:molybdate transport system substrate-binding protein